MSTLDYINASVQPVTRDGAPVLDVIHHRDWLALLADLPDTSVDMILTDMPYGTTACTWDTVIDLGAWWVEAHRVAKSRAAIVCTGSQPFTSALVMSNAKRFRYEWIWDKKNPSGFLNANRQPLRRHENALCFSSDSPYYFPQMGKGKPYRVNRGGQADHYGNITRRSNGVNNGERFPTSLLEFPHGGQKYKSIHPTQKPVALFEYLIRTYTQPGDLVLDPFAGSGTTAVAARNTGRRYICGDMDAGYVATARARLAQPFARDMFDTLPAEPAQQHTQTDMFGAK